jgi:putative transcriptional regulator
LKEKINIEKGSVFLAEPYLQEGIFHRSAILICDVHDNGCMGFCMNKPLAFNEQVGQLVKDFPVFDSEVYCGGPVGNDKLFFLHNLGDLLEGAEKICEGVYLGGNFKELKVFIENELITPDRIRFFVGYSGWDSGQLEEEIEEGTWISAEMDPNYLFKQNPTVLWQTILKNKGNPFHVIADIPDSIIWN